jgi:hypothetical protein
MFWPLLDVGAQSRVKIVAAKARPFLRRLLASQISENFFHDLKEVAFVCRLEICIGGHR